MQEHGHMRPLKHRQVSRQIARSDSWVVFLLLLVILGVLMFRSLRPRPHYAIHVKQRAQLHSITTGLELHANESEGYPPSDANDPAGLSYCGAMKLCEATMGQDLLGFHSKSAFRRDGLDAAGTLDLYPNDMNALEPAVREANLKARRGPYLMAESANAYRLVDIYGQGHTGPFAEDLFVLCDTYIRMRPSGKKTGMPILYYRADVKGPAHDVNDPDNPENIYDYRDNLALIDLGVPGESKGVHPLSDPKRFYMNTQSDKIRTGSKPYRADTFILISAGLDGLYGTADDICNFEWKYRE